MNTNQDETLRSMNVGNTNTLAASSYQNFNADAPVNKSDIEMQSRGYSSVPNRELEDSLVERYAGSSNHSTQSIGWTERLLKLAFILALLGSLYWVLSDSIHSRSQKKKPSRTEGYLDETKPGDMPGRHIHLSREQIGMTGLEGLTLDQIHVERTNSSKAHEGKSTVHEYECYLYGDKAHPLATGSLEKNAGGRGWAYLSVRSTMSPSSPAERTPAPVSPTKDTPKSAHHAEDPLLVQWLQTRLGMGFLEGFTTCTGIQDWYTNSYQAQFDGGDPNEEILRFLEANHDWMVLQADSHWRTSDYWLSIKGRLAQLHGLLAGIRAGCPGSDEPRLLNIPILPANGGKSVQELDNHRDWIGQSRKDNLYTAHFNKVGKVSAKGSIYLANMKRTPSLIHLLILNANGDLYQIGDKFNIFADKPMQKEGARTNRKRVENKKYMLKNHTLTDQDDDNQDDDGDFSKSRWGRATQEVSDEKSFAASDTKMSLHSGRRRRVNGLKHRRKILQDDTEEHTEGGRAFDEKLEPYVLGDHCSSLIKLLPNYSDVAFGHNTWDDYQNAFPRIFKTYEYPFMRNATPAEWHRSDFSSSPGLLASIDDFYILKSSAQANLAVIETSIDIYNRTYLDYIKPESVLAWMRVVTANEMATNGSTWSNIFSESASGTYMDQWMVIDMNKFTPGTAPSAGFFTVLEEMPGSVHWEDMTDHIVKATYWASYNNPYFTDIRDKTGQTALCIKNSLECYSTDPRGQIFHHLQKDVKTVADLQVVMQYNHWQTDALSMNDSCRAIACRGDLEADLALWSPHGAVDAKVSSYKLASSQIDSHIPPIVHAKLGPTVDSQIPFCWAQFDNVTDMAGQNIKHRGHPRCFNFDWVNMPRPSTAGVVVE